MWRYVGCGLDYVYLCNGYEFHATLSGTEVVRIRDVTGLHRAMAQWVCNVSRPLSPREVKFLRKELDLSPRDLASLAGVDEQAVLMWERGEYPIALAAERLLRTLMTEHNAATGLVVSARG